MKIGFDLVIELFLGIIFIMAGLSVMISSISDGSLFEFIFGFVFIFAGASVLYLGYQCNGRNGKWASVPSFRGPRLAKRSTLSEEEMERAFGPDYKDYMPRVDPFTDSKNAHEAENPSSDPSNAFLIFFSVPAILVGSMALVIGISSNQLIAIILGGVFLVVGVAIISIMLYKRRVYRGEARPMDPAKKANVSGYLLPGVVFSSIGGFVIFIGCISSRDNVVYIIFGSIFLLFGIFMLYFYIKNMRPNSNKVTMDVGATTVTVDRSTLTDEEYRDITDSDGPSYQTMNNVVNRNVNWSATFLVLAIIGLIMAVIMFAISINSIVGIMSALGPIIFSAICFRMYIKAKKSDKGIATVVTPKGPLPVDKDKLTDEQSEILFGPEEARDPPQPKYQSPTYQDTNKSSWNNKKKPANGVYRYVNCPHCGAINIEGNKTCYSCKKKI